jgi:hypothetical protein
MSEFRYDCDSSDLWSTDLTFNKNELNEEIVLCCVEYCASVLNVILFGSLI